MSKINTIDSANTLYKARESTLNAFKNKVFPLNPSRRKGLNLLTPKQMLQRLAIFNAQIKAGKTSENLLHENCKII